MQMVYNHTLHNFELKEYSLSEFIYDINEYDISDIEFSNDSSLLWAGRPGDSLRYIFRMPVS